jgi:uncharacterized membrane protein
MLDLIEISKTKRELLEKKSQPNGRVDDFAKLVGNNAFVFLFFFCNCP